MFMTPPEYDAYCLYKAMKGLGTNEGVLIEIIGTRSPQQLMAVKVAFRQMYNEDLEKWVKDKQMPKLYIEREKEDGAQMNQPLLKFLRTVPRQKL